MKLHQAIEFAAICHRDQTRKGSNTPYIAHPMEVLAILTANGADEITCIAGVLHDTVEDTAATAEQIRDLFGEEVAAIVADETEDKSLPWAVRKQLTIDRLPKQDLRVKMICCADKLSNLVSIYSDMLKVGESVWDRFTGKRDRAQGYYSGIIKALYPLNGLKMYEQLCKYYALVFGEEICG